MYNTVNIEDVKSGKDQNLENMMQDTSYFSTCGYIKKLQWSRNHQLDKIGLMNISVGTIHRCIDASRYLSRDSYRDTLRKNRDSNFFFSVDSSRHRDSIPVIVFLACDFRGPGTNLIGP